MQISMLIQAYLAVSVEFASLIVAVFKRVSVECAQRISLPPTQFTVQKSNV